MRKQFGTRIMEKPQGMLHSVHFPSMATMDKKTGDGRLLEAAGQGVRDLPRPIYGQFEQAPGHEKAVIVGRLDAVQFDDDGNIEGWGWLIDDASGMQMATYLATKTLFHNSVDLAEIKVKFDIEEEDDMLSLLVRFTEWNIAATTFVGKPAFADAHGVIDDELTAALASDEPLECMVGSFEVRVEKAEELMAALATDDATLVAWSDFHIPESDGPQKIVVDGEGKVYGHLALWDTPVEGYAGRLVRPPRPADNYASFNQAGPLTELGQVETGPIFFAGGHPEKPLGGRDPYEAYGGVENAWCDVRVTPGVYGPWVSGRVRPGVADSVVYAARASRISGHWVGDRLRAIVSVNVPRFNIPGSGKLASTVCEATFGEHGELLELVASFPDWLDTASDADEVDDEADELEERLADQLSLTEMAVDTTPTTEMASEAELGLQWRKEFKRGGGGVAVARARDIKNRKKLSTSTLKRMAAFFKRHEVDKGSKGWMAGEDGYPSAGRINWALWGGDAAAGWVNGKLALIEQEAAAALEAEVLLLQIQLADD